MGTQGKLKFARITTMVFFDSFETGILRGALSLCPLISESVRPHLLIPRKPPFLAAHETPKQPSSLPARFSPQPETSPGPSYRSGVGDWEPGKPKPWWTTWGRGAQRSSEAKFAGGNTGGTSKMFDHAPISRSRFYFQVAGVICRRKLNHDNPSQNDIRRIWEEYTHSQTQNKVSLLNVARCLAIAS